MENHRVTKMHPNVNEKTSTAYWHDIYAASPPPALPSGWGIIARDRQRLFRRYIPRRSSVLEIGCAPGIWLAWLAKTLDVRPSGLDYSPLGVESARKLFARLSLTGDLQCEDVFSTSFAPASFDVVYSGGVIEHFDDPAPLVRLHAKLAKPGGRVLITIPRFRGVYEFLRRRCDPDSALTHNLKIMEVDALRRLAPADLAENVETFAYGRLGSCHIGLERKWPRRLVRGIRALENGLGYLQPFNLPSLCPNLVLTFVRKAEQAVRPSNAA
jgi:SAM-dependent methyltransferase